MSRSSLFSKLLSLTSSEKIIRKEDFFTEIFARLLREMEILDFFLLLADLSNKHFQRPFVGTQVTYEALEQHNKEDSRPDIVIKSDDTIIFIENKIGSSENPGQLKKYAEHLESILQKEKYENAKLIYITRDWEDKDENEIKADCDENSDIQFVPLRWHNVYKLLKNINNNAKIEMFKEEVIKFMEEHNMARNDQFDSVDLLTLMNYTNLRKKLLDTMDEEVDEQVIIVSGNDSVKDERKTSLKNRVIRYTDLEIAGISNSMWLGYGFNLDPPGNDSYPDLTINLETRKDLMKSPLFKRIIELLRDGSLDGWEAYQEDSIWYGIRKRKSIKEILSAESHIKEAQLFFKNSIAELEEKIKELQNIS